MVEKGLPVRTPKQPKGKPTASPTPTPHPEERDARDMESGETLSLSVVLKGGKIRVYEPTLVCKVDLDGDFDIGFKSMKVESELEVETKLAFEKELCVRIYGYGIDWDSGKKFMGKRVAVHIGVGIYAVIGVNGEITITAKIETVGTINGGVKGNFWPFLVGVPAGYPYIYYDSDKFETSISLDGKIHAWAYVGPQLTIDVLDFNLVTAQIWLGLEADAVIHGEASTEGNVSVQLGVSADFVALFRAWLFNKPFEYYLLRLRLFEKVFNWKTGQTIAEDSQENKEITPAIIVDGADAYTDTIWGSVWYMDKNNTKINVAHTPVQIIIFHNNGSSDVFQTTTDVNGQFVFRQESPGLLATDTVKVKIDHSVQDGNKTIVYKAETMKPIIPSVPFVPFVLEADAFNDIVSGKVSPSVPCPGHPSSDPYTGPLSIIVEENGRVVARKDTNVTDGTFSVNFEDPMDLSGGRTAYASINYEGATIKSDQVEVNLDNLILNVDCLIGGIGGRDASKVGNPPRVRGITVSDLYIEGTVTNLKNLKPYQGNVRIGVTFIREEDAFDRHIDRKDEYETFGWGTSIPVQVHSAVNRISSLNGPDDIIVANLDKPVLNSPGIRQPSVQDINIPEFLTTLLPYSTFKYEVPSDVFADPEMRVLSINIYIEHDGLTKSVSYNWNIQDFDIKPDTSSESGQNILGGESNAIKQIYNEKLDSRINWPDVMLIVGNSQMRVNGVLTAIDGKKNQSVMVVDGNVFVPIEAVVKALGGSVTYGTGQKLGITLNNITAECTGGSKSLKVNGIAKTMTQAPFMTSGGTMMLPVSFLSDNLGLKTEWSPETGTLSIWSQDTGINQNQTMQHMPSQVPPSQNQTQAATWTGVWYTDYGIMLLTQNGNKVSGTYGDWENNFPIEGTVDGNKLTGTVIDYGNNGKVEMTLLQDGRIKARTIFIDGERIWECVKMSDDFGTPGTTWGGVWSSDLGTMVLYQEGSKVYGIRKGYLLGEISKVEGTVSDSVLKGQILDESGKEIFELSINSDGKSFTGTYYNSEYPKMIYKCQGMKKK